MLSRFDFNITNNNYEDLQTGYKPETTTCNMKWSVNMIGLNILELILKQLSITNPIGQYLTPQVNNSPSRSLTIPQYMLFQVYPWKLVLMYGFIVETTLLVCMII